MITFKEFNESFTTSQITNLKKQWATVKTINPTGEKYKALVKWIKDKPYEMLHDLAMAKINFISYIAKKALMDKETLLAIFSAAYSGDLIIGIGNLFLSVIGVLIKPGLTTDTLTLCLLKSK